MLDAIVLKNHSKKPLKWVYKFCRNFELRKIFVIQLIFTHVYCFVNILVCKSADTCKTFVVVV